MREPPVLDHTQILRLKEWGGTDLQRKMIELFLTHSVERVNQIRDGLAQQNSKAAETGAHTLKSSAGNVGARRLQELCAHVESMAEREDLQQVRELFPTLEGEFESASEALRTLLEELPE
jgi:two-component system, sensor histidine kinase and response regulator